MHPSPQCLNSNKNNSTQGLLLADIIDIFCAIVPKRILEKAEDNVPLPHYVTVGIIVIVLGVVLMGLYFLCCKFLKKKKKGKKNEKKGLLGKGGTGGDLQFGQQPLGQEDDEDEAEEVDEKEKEESEEKQQFLG